MATTADIMLALFERVASLNTGSPDLPIAYPEHAETFVPPADGKYIEVAFFSNRPAWEGLSAGRIDQGLLMLNVVWPKNKGLIAPGQIADLIIAHFPKGQQMASGVRVFRQPYAAAPLIDSDRVTIPVTVAWTA